MGRWNCGCDPGDEAGTLMQKVTEMFTKRTKHRATIANTKEIILRLYRRVALFKLRGRMKVWSALSASTANLSQRNAHAGPLNRCQKQLPSGLYQPTTWPGSYSLSSPRLSIRPSVWPSVVNWAPLELRAVGNVRMRLNVFGLLLTGLRISSQPRPNYPPFSSPTSSI